MQATIEFYRQLYTQRLDEERMAYYKRITDSIDGETNEKYLWRLKLLEELFPKIGLWNVTMYLNLTQKYYALSCTIHPGLSQLEYVTLLFNKGPDETNGAYVDRINTIRRSCQFLIDWPNPQVLYSFYKVGTLYYKLINEQYENETFNQYLIRQFTHYPGESNYTFASKINMFATVMSDLPIWYNSSFLSYTLPYYWYQCRKRSRETERMFVRRIVQRYNKDTVAIQLKKREFFNGVYTGNKLLKNKNFINTKFVKRNQKYLLNGQVRINL